MKKYLIILLSTIPILTYSQSVFTEELLWSTAEGPGGNCGKFFCWSYYTKIAGDTTINEISYKKVWKSIDSFKIDWSVTGFMREEGQKVFYRKRNAETDCLLYNFGCSVGDTLNLNCSCPENSKFKVDSIKYLPIMGESRKHIYLTYLIEDSIKGPTEYWIEGIGSITGILNGGGPHNCMTGGGEMLICCSRNGELIYKNSEYDCYLGPKIINSTSEFRTKKQPLVKLYPNPAFDEINLQFNKSPGSFCQLKILTVFGTIVRSIKIDANDYNLDVKSLKPGLYIIQVNFGTEVYSEKVLIN